MYALNKISLYLSMFKFTKICISLEKPSYKRVKVEITNQKRSCLDETLNNHMSITLTTSPF